MKNFISKVVLTFKIAYLDERIKRLQASIVEIEQKDLPPRWERNYYRLAVAKLDTLTAERRALQ